VQTVGDSAFGYCVGLTSVSLPQVQTVGESAFNGCTSLASVSLPQVQTVGGSAFGDCSSLASVSLPQVQTVGDYAFGACGGLTSLYFDNDAPTIGADIFAGITPNQVKIYVTNPQATVWVDRLGDMPVVRLPLYADAIYQAGELVATTQQVAQAVTDEAALRVSGTNALHVEISGATAAASAATNQSASALAIAQSATNTASTALALGVTATDTVTLVSSALGTHTNDAGIHVTSGDKAAWYGVTNAPAWISVTNAAGDVTVTNDLERPVTLYATNNVSLSFSGLRPPLPLWLEAFAEGTNAVAFADAYAVGGFSWQTNRVNLFAVWASGTNVFVTPVTTRAKE
jgi:hypothetical protein